MKGGLLGALMAWLGFTLPSALFMTAFGMAVSGLDAGASHMWLHGLKVVAVAVVAQALWGMGDARCVPIARARAWLSARPSSPR
jgi:chromate transporter